MGFGGIFGTSVYCVGTYVCIGDNQGFENDYRRNNRAVNIMTNADKFKSIFGLYATELWAKPEKDFLEWLNADAELLGNSEQLDTISRAAVLDEIHKYMEERDYTIGTLYDNICEMPSAQPDIVACGDCIHWICHDRRCGYWNHGVKPLDWCCHAERRSDG